MGDSSGAGRELGPLADHAGVVRAVTANEAQVWCFDHRQSVAWNLPKWNTYIVHISVSVIQDIGLGCEKTLCGRRLFNMTAAGPRDAESICASCARSYFTAAKRLRVMPAGREP